MLLIASILIALKLLIVCSVPATLSFSYGLTLGSPTVIIPQIKKRLNNTNAVSDEMASWTSSIVNFSGIAWVIFLTILAHYIGRKKTTFILNIGLFFAFLNMYLSLSIMQVFISLAVLGLTAASMKTLSIMIITEYTSRTFRGVMLTCKVASLFWGIWVSNAIGTFFMWENIAIIGMLCSLYCFLVTIFMPESPIWLASRGKFDVCGVSHRWLKGYDSDSEKELETLIKTQKTNREENETKKLTIFNVLQYYWSMISKPEIYKPLCCSVLVGCLYDWSGKLTYTVYSLDMIKKITNSERAAYIGMLILDGFSVISIYMSSFLIKCLKRKTLLISSTSVCIFFLYALSIYIILVKNSVLPENSYISIAMLVGYSIGVCCGPVVLAAVLCGELIPTKCRSFCFLVIALTTKITVGLFLKISPLIFKAIGFHGIFLTFGTTSSFLLFLIYKYLPETKDKTLDEITELFESREPKELRNVLLANKNNCNEMTEFETKN